MKKSSIVMIGILTAAVLLTGCQFIFSVEVRYGIIEGWVYESTARPDDIIVMPSNETPRGYRRLPDAIVEVRDYYDSGVIVQTKADSSGRIYIPQLTTGKKLLIIQHPDYSGIRVEIPVYVWRDTVRVTSEPTVHYVIVGIDEYPKMKAENLKVSEKDAKNIKTVLVDGNRMKGYADILTNRQATKSNIKRAIENAARSAKPGDSLVFYFSGYADPEIYAGGETPPLDHIVPYDGQDYGTAEQIRNSMITDGELRDWLSKFPNKNVTVILDVAYAETFFDGKIRSQSLGAIMPMALQGTGYTVLGAASDGERTIVSSDKGSLFTTMLVDGIKSIGDDKITAWTLFNYAENAMRKFPQNPQFEGPKHTVIYIRNSYYW